MITRYLVKLFGLLLLLQSCSWNHKDIGFEKALNFYNTHSTEFLNSELYKFSYHPRTQYDFITQDSTSFRILIRDRKELLILNSLGFIKMFNLPVDTFYKDDRTIFSSDNFAFRMNIECFNYKKYSDSNGTINKEIRTNIKYTFPIESIKINPIEYFTELEKLRNKFGIINYSRKENDKFFTLYFSSYDYLIYIPDDSLFNREKRKNHENKLKSGKKLDNNWYYFKSEKALDVG